MVFLFLTESYAQKDYRFKNYTINNGLSQSSATTIIQDDLNALWVGTQDGLNRYDGRVFEIFTSDDTEGLESEYILCSHKDKKGNLWFGTSKGLTKYNFSTERFKTYTTKRGAPIRIEDITEDDTGSLWVATTDFGVFKLEGNSGTLKSPLFFMPSKKTTNIEFVKKGLIVISTEDKGVFLCDTKNNKVTLIEVKQKKGLPLVVNKLIPGGKNVILLATNSGVFETNYHTQKSKLLFAGPDQQNVSDAYFEKGVGWLVCTKNNGLFIINEKGVAQHSTEDVFQRASLLFNELNCIYKDVSGTFWIGSQRGVSSFNPLSRGILGVGPSGDLHKGIPTASVWSFEETASSVFIGTENAVSQLAKKKGTFIQYERKKLLQDGKGGERAVLALKAISETHLLVGCVDGLFDLKIKGSGHEFIKIETKGLNRAYSIVHWKDDFYWVATKKGAFLYDVKKQKVEVFVHDPNNKTKTISKGVCRLVYKDLDGSIWFTTSVGGLNRLVETEKGLTIIPYKDNKAIKEVSTEYITSINNVKKNIYWLGTMGSGLLRWDSSLKKVELFNKSKGLPNNVIYGVLSDGESGLWLSTNKGVCNFNPKTKKTKNYTEADGLMSNEFNLGAHMITREGVLYFGGIYGYNHFKPEELVSNKKDINVVFSKLKIDGDWLKPNDKGSPLTKPIFLTGELNLSYKQRSFTIAFQSSDLSGPKKINYKYLLEGSNEGEILLGPYNEIHFNALSPGSYILKVYARLADGTWSSRPAVLKITIGMPFWGRWWFLLACISFLVFSIRLFVRQRTEASRREQVRLEMKVSDRTKELKAQSKKIERQKEKIEEERNNVVLQQGLLQQEKDKTEELLKNVLPTATAEELKRNGKARARAYKTVSVIFTDFVGFTKVSDQMPATELVKKLDVYFTKFDEIIVNNNLEKIKTIGDAYMCAGGVPEKNTTNPLDACLAALQIQAYMFKRKKKAITNGGDHWALRLGINTGDVIAGVIGSERLAFDVWGATVNHAQRMEMLGEAEKVTITGSTFSFIEPFFDCVFKGKAQTKSRGFIDMYVVNQIKPELSVKGEGVFPNEKFNQLVKLYRYNPIKYYKAERHIMKELEAGLPTALHYHSVAKTKDVVLSVERLALAEGVTDEGLFLLKTAALYHNAGFLGEYFKNKETGARLADEFLPRNGYTPRHIKIIKELIFVIKNPHGPTTKLEEVICDANLNYLGRNEFHLISNKLRNELNEQGEGWSEKKWDELQVLLLKNHRYFTKTAKKNHNKKKAQNLQEVLWRLQRDEYK
ncbi:MAG: adenylate/guanylate cyclase domain-containing protein [Crocinitomicaceae bacterium]